MRLALKRLNIQFLLRMMLLYTLMFVVIAAPSSAHGQEPNGGYTWDGTYRRVRVPILVYDSLTPEMFQQHLDTLFYQGYTPISLNDLDRVLLTGERLPPEPVILTFDGGRRDAYDQVFPVLQAHGFTATFFVTTGLVDNADPSVLTWQQIGEMAAAGMHMSRMARRGRICAAAPTIFSSMRCLAARRAWKLTRGSHRTCSPIRAEITMKG
ncbi:MAG: polysaccharide deacetylase family protein [Anaerolineae bacterium]